MHNDSFDYISMSNPQPISEGPDYRSFDLQGDHYAWPWATIVDVTAQHVAYCLGNPCLKPFVTMDWPADQASPSA